MNSATATGSLRETILGLVRVRDYSIREIVAQTGADPLAIETELFAAADALVLGGDAALAYRARFLPANFDMWPHGVSPEIVEAYESVQWRWGGPTDPPVVPLRARKRKK